MVCDCDPEDFSPTTLMWNISEGEGEKIKCTECDKPYTGKLDMSVKENIEAKLYNVVMDRRRSIVSFQ